MSIDKINERIEELLVLDHLSSDHLDILDGLQADLLDILLPQDEPVALSQLLDSPATSLLIDILTGMTWLDRSDPAHPWHLATALRSATRLYEAALAYMEAARRAAARAQTVDAITDDEADWARAAIQHASECFREAGMTISSLVLASEGVTRREIPEH